MTETTVPNTVVEAHQKRLDELKTLGHADKYKTAGHTPTVYRHIRDDMAIIIEHCIDLAYDWYVHGGGVIQIQPSQYLLGTARFFVSFNVTNDGRQHIHEASGEGIVINHSTSDNPLQDLLDAMKTNLLPVRPRI
jgi:hypothetical protein